MFAIGQLPTQYTCTCIARSLRTFSHKHRFSVCKYNRNSKIPMHLILCSWQTIILAAYGCEVRS